MLSRPGIGLPVYPNTRNTRNTRRVSGTKNRTRTRSGTGTGTSLKPVQIPEIPDLPEIETVLNICECVKRNCVKNEISRYNCKENRVFPSSFFPKDPIISKVLICNWTMGYLVTRSQD